jgi:hypothetical protein
MWPSSIQKPCYNIFFLIVLTMFIISNELFHTRTKFVQNSIIETLPQIDDWLQGFWIEEGHMYLCGYCKTKSYDLKRCSGCRLVSYCSKACQSSAWPDHSLTCTKLNRKKNMLIKIVDNFQRLLEIYTCVSISLLTSISFNSVSF